MVKAQCIVPLFLGNRGFAFMRYTSIHPYNYHLDSIAWFFVVTWHAHSLFVEGYSPDRSDLEAHT